MENNRQTGSIKPVHFGSGFVRGMMDSLKENRQSLLDRRNKNRETGKSTNAAFGKQRKMTVDERYEFEESLRRDKKKELVQLIVAALLLAVFVTVILFVLFRYM